MFLVDAVADMVREQTSPHPETLEMLKTTAEALEKVKSLLRSRREILIQRGVPSAKTQA